MRSSSPGNANPSATMFCATDSARSTFHTLRALHRVRLRLNLSDSALQLLALLGESPALTLPEIHTLMRSDQTSIPADTNFTLAGLVNLCLVTLNNAPVRRYIITPAGREVILELGDIIQSHS